MQTVSDHQRKLLKEHGLSFSQEHNRMLRVGTRVRWYLDKSVIGVISDIVAGGMLLVDTIYHVEWIVGYPKHMSGQKWGGGCFGARLMPILKVFATWR